MKTGADPFDQTHRFTSRLFHSGGKGGWTFAPLPEGLALPVTGSWGMTPVLANVDGKGWHTTIWRDTKMQRTLLPVPKRIRGGKGDGDLVEVELRLDRERILGPNHPVE